MTEQGKIGWKTWALVIFLTIILSPIWIVLGFVVLFGYLMYAIAANIHHNAHHPYVSSPIMVGPSWLAQLSQGGPVTKRWGSSSPYAGQTLSGKTCPNCQSSIATSASICPYCRTQQGGLGL